MKVAIAGAGGYMGRQFLGAALSAGDEICVCDPSFSEAPPGTYIAAGADELFGWEPDCVILSLQPSDRKEYLEALPGYRGPCLVEKPFAGPPGENGDTEEAARLLDLYGGNENIMFDFTEIFRHTFRRSLEYMDELGLEPSTYHMVTTKDRDFGGDERNSAPMHDITCQDACHRLAIPEATEMHLGGGGILVVRADTKDNMTHPYQKGKIGEVSGSFATWRGATGSFLQSFLIPGRRNYRIIGLTDENGDRYAFEFETHYVGDRFSDMLSVYLPGNRFDEPRSIVEAPTTNGETAYNALKRWEDTGEKPEPFPGKDFALKVWNVTRSLDRSIKNDRQAEVVTEGL